MTFTKTTKLLTTAALALALSACATSDDKYKVGVDDNDKFESTVGNVPQDDAKMMKKDDSMMAETERAIKKGVNKVEGAVVSVGNPKVGGASMMANETIVQNASKAPNLTTLVSAVKQAQLVETLSSKGPFTVFAPTNSAFNLVDSETLGSLMQDANRPQLQKVLKGHVVSGKVTAKDLMDAVKANNGSHTITTVSGDTLTVYVTDGKVKISDERGYLATVQTADVMQSNGVVHVINSVLIGN